MPSRQFFELIRSQDERKPWEIAPELGQSIETIGQCPGTRFRSADFAKIDLDRTLRAKGRALRKRKPGHFDAILG